MAQSTANGVHTSPRFYEVVLSHPSYAHNPIFVAEAGKFNRGERAEANCSKDIARRKPNRHHHLHHHRHRLICMQGPFRVIPGIYL